MNNTELFNSLGIGDKVKIAGLLGVYLVIQSPAPEGQSGKWCFIEVKGPEGVIRVTRDESYRVQLLERFPDRSSAPPMWNLINDGN